jgi:hypothetical protein
MNVHSRDLQAGLSHPQRRNRRFPVQLWAIERSGESTYHHRVTNLSVNGMFFQKELPIRPGTTFHMELALPSGRVIRAEGTVVHATSTEDGPGNGIAISSMFEEDRETLREYLAGVPLH